MKYQFQFAGANVSRRSAQPKKKLRLVILMVGFAFAVLAYTNYVFNIFHVPFLQSPVIATAGTASAASTATAAAQPKAKDGKKASSSLQEAAATGVAAVEGAVNKALTAVHIVAAPAAPTVVAVPAPVAPVAPVAQDGQPTVVSITTIPAKVIAPVVPVAALPVIKYTPQERLMRAGQIAFQQAMESAKTYPDAYGFHAEDTFSEAKLGDPMPIYTIDESDRAKYQHGESVKPMLKETKQWAFPITCRGRVCCMVTVSYTGRDYVPGKGSKVLGMAWNKITERWPAEEGYHPCIVVNSEVPGYYFTVPELSDPNMTDIVRLFDFQTRLSPADVILASWR